MSEQRRRMTDQDIAALNDIILQSHYRQLREQQIEGCRNMYGVYPAATTAIVKHSTEFTLADRVFLQALGINPEGATNGR